MSEVITMTSKVKFKDITLLTTSMISVGSMCTHIKDYYGKLHESPLAFHSSEFPDGIAFTLNTTTGEYEPSADSYGKIKAAETLLNKLAQSYQQHAWNQVLVKHRYTAQIENKEGRITIKASGY